MKFLLPAAVMLLSACSIYESEGRKFLENQGLQFAGVAAQGNLVSCERGASTSDWVLLERNEKADVYALEGTDYKLRVVTAADLSFSCVYKFSSAQELYEKTPAAIDNALSHRS